MLYYINGTHNYASTQQLAKPVVKDTAKNRARVNQLEEAMQNLQKREGSTTQKVVETPLPSEMPPTESR